MYSPKISLQDILQCVQIPPSNECLSELPQADNPIIMQIDNIKHNRSLTTYTINTILDKLDIKLSDFMEYKPKNKAN